MGGMLQDLAFAIPGVDEAMGFAEIMKCVSARGAGGQAVGQLLPLPTSEDRQVRRTDMHATSSRIALQTRKIDAVLGHCLRHGAHGAYAPLPLVPFRPREGSRKAIDPLWQVWANDAVGACGSRRELANARRGDRRREAGRACLPCSSSGRTGDLLGRWS